MSFKSTNSLFERRFHFFVVVVVVSSPQLSFVEVVGILIVPPMETMIVGIVLVPMTQIMVGLACSSNQQTALHKFDPILGSIERSEQHKWLVFGSYNHGLQLQYGGLWLKIFELWRRQKHTWSWVFKSTPGAYNIFKNTPRFTVTSKISLGHTNGQLMSLT